jgi:hypothetical protein
MQSVTPHRMPTTTSPTAVSLIGTIAWVASMQHAMVERFLKTLKHHEIDARLWGSRACSQRRRRVHRHGEQLPTIALRPRLPIAQQLKASNPSKQPLIHVSHACGAVQKRRDRAFVIVTTKL